MAITDRRGVSVSATDSPVAGTPNAGLAIKTACLCATTGSNIVLSGVQTIDGVSVGNNSERVLVKDQADQTTNGIYNASTGIWTRATDANGNTELAQGTQVLVLSGTINGSYKWYVCTATANPIVLGSSPITWAALNYPSSAFEFVMDGGGVPIVAGFKGTIEVPFACRITRYTLMADQAGALVMDIRKATFTAPTSGTSIVASDPPTLSAQQSNQDSALTGWSTQLNAGDVLAFYVTGSASVNIATLSLLVTRS